MPTREIISDYLTVRRQADSLVAILSEESKRGLEALDADASASLLRDMGNSAKVRAILLDDVIAGIFGVITKDWGGQLWFLTSVAVVHYPLAFMREAVKVFDDLVDGYEQVMNITHADNQLTLNLAKHFGFVIHPKEPHGAKGEDHHLVVWQKGGTNVYGG